MIKKKICALKRTFLKNMVDSGEFTYFSTKIQKHILVYEMFAIDKNGNIESIYINYKEYLKFKKWKNRKSKTKIRKICYLPKILYIYIRKNI